MDADQRIDPGHFLYWLVRLVPVAAVLAVGVAVTRNPNTGAGIAMLAIAAVLVTWFWLRRRHPLRPVTFDCGRDDCRWRSQINHRHKTAAS